ncbi:hypothetical protein QC762_121595 [Podospora pseudocomata]|uniref:Uncharacterized protein n=1 Tax=Podospora pseudocomata TaxID=2093779 RepID=A0ABR0GYJ8_9PEZI|nr:hypothetical protein QC762_121595 [Podospora pseudocomata]
MTTRYTVQVEEADSDIKTLHGNAYLLQVAKAVATGGKASVNVVYASKLLAPHMNVQWTTVYGINWATEMPAQGATVTYSGKWKQCNLGDSYTLTQDGVWAATQENPNAKENALNIASNDYEVPVHVLVGVQDPSTKMWTPIWFGNNKLLKGSHGEYEPIETVNIWYQQGDQTATMISNQATSIQSYDMPASHPVYFSYDAAKGKWRTPQDVTFNFP